MALLGSAARLRQPGLLVAAPYRLRVPSTGQLDQRRSFFRSVALDRESQAVKARSTNRHGAVGALYAGRSPDPVVVYKRIEFVIVEFVSVFGFSRSTDKTFR